MAIRRAPDIPYELVTFLNNNEYHMIYKERTLLKKLFISDMDINILDEISRLRIPHYNFHNNVLVDDNNEFLYLINKYLDPNRYISLEEAISTLPLKERLHIIKDLLNDLKIAHSQKFNPFDLHHGNYLYGPDFEKKDDEMHPIFIDFDVTYYKGKPTFAAFDGFIANLQPFNIKNDDTTIKNLNINDKLLAFYILLTALTTIPEHFGTNLVQQLIIQYDILLEEYYLDKSIEERFTSIIKDHQTPNPNDYFEDILDNLENGGIIKKK